MAGQHVAVLKPVGTILLFAFLLWSARAQLAGSWLALVEAKAVAQERERAAQAANQAKSDFLATMSHEIRTPLNGVLGMAQAMAAEELSDDQRGRLRVIRRSGETLLAILNDILDLSKVEAGELEIEDVEFDMEHLVRGAVAAFKTRDCRSSSWSKRAPAAISAAIPPACGSYSTISSPTP
jgi:signal transduction histidine kinase